MTRGRRRLLTVLAVIAIAPLLVLAVVDWRLTSALSRIDGAFDGLGDRPPAATDGSVTVLMLVTGEGVASSPTLTWMPGHPRVESALFVTIAGDRLEAYVDWLLLGDSMLAALSDSEPSASVAAAESWTGKRVDHLAVVEWSAFRHLGRDNDVRLDLPPGASRRAQQTFLRTVLEDSLHSEMRKQPLALYRGLHTVAEGMAVERGWSTYDMNRLVFSLRNLRSARITFGAVDQPATR